MKAKVIKEKVYEGGIAYSHGAGFYIKRLWLDEIGGFAITIHEGRLYVLTRFTPSDGYELVDEIEVSNDLVEDVGVFLRVEEAILNHQEVRSALLEED